MSDIKISDMTVATGFIGNAFLPIVESGLNKRVSATTLFSNIQDPVVINAINEDNDTIIKGITDNDLIHVDASTNRVGISTPTPLSTLDLDGSFRFNGYTVAAGYVSQSSSGTVDLSSDSTIVDSTSPVSLQINTAIIDGQLKTIYKKGSGTLVLNSGGGTSIAGAASVAFNNVGSSITLHSINGVWYIKSLVNCTIS